jgi:hypothetical protein
MGGNRTLYPLGTLKFSPRKTDYALWFWLRIMKLSIGFEVLTAVKTKMAVFWVVALCSLVEFYQRFRGPLLPPSSGPDDGGNKDP